MTKIVDLQPRDDQLITEVAALLVEAFRQRSPNAWPETGSAPETVRESFGEGHISRVALDEQGAVVGWIGGLSTYDGLVWAMHQFYRKQGYTIVDVIPDANGHGKPDIIMANGQAGSVQLIGHQTICGSWILPERAFPLRQKQEETSKLPH